MKYENIINKMTLEEKASLCVGKDYWNSENIERLGIPSIKMSDGPHGLRVQKEKGDNLGVNKSEVAICFPSSATIAARSTSVSKITPKSEPDSVTADEMAFMASLSSGFGI